MSKGKTALFVANERLAEHSSVINIDDIEGVAQSSIWQLCRDWSNMAVM